MSRAVKKRKAPPPQKTVMTLSDKLLAFGIPGVIFGSLIYILISGNIEKHSMVLDRTLSKWQSLYHLDEGQKAEIKRIEVEFHGKGNPFAVRTEHSREEIREHHVSISKVMKPEDGSRFLEAMEREQRSH
ncbi:hypothetical protein DES53_111121 [Roseimicrobium gellanilyticum]|uniref:Uncharacterized protein n=1 Tax=Roseimicrobium gellanilyticum TaxID=748857 RepID=A0A366HAJ6_9BACT|nr:hypothetical protein DES53_111121 [Roseimicrobium gellanilyticum]